MSQKAELSVNSVLKFDKDTVIVENYDGDKVMVAKINNRVIVFSINRLDDEEVLLVSNKYEIEKDLHEKFLHVVAKMSMKPCNSKYFKACDSLNFTNGEGIKNITLDECMILKNRTSYLHQVFNMYILTYLYGPEDI